MSVAALVMAAVSNAKADGVLLSPRAAGNQMEVASTPGTNSTVMAAQTSTANSGALLAPGARGHQIVKTEGTNGDPDLVSLGLTPDEYVIMKGYGLPPTSAYALPRAKSPPSAPPYEIAPVK